MRKEALCLSINLLDRFLAANPAEDVLKECDLLESINAISIEQFYYFIIAVNHLITIITIIHSFFCPKFPAEASNQTLHSTYDAYDSIILYTYNYIFLTVNKSNCSSYNEVIAIHVIL